MFWIAGRAYSDSIFRLLQAADTDILALVEIEKNSRHHFEFYMGRVCDEPISARTAYTYAKAGGKIAHGLSVYECRLRQPKQVLRHIIIRVAERNLRSVHFISRGLACRCLRKN